MKRETIHVVIGFVAVGVMLSLGVMRLTNAQEMATNADKFYVEQFATNQTWVNNLNCRDVALIIGAGEATSWLFEFKSRPQFENWYVENQCGEEKDAVR